MTAPAANASATVYFNNSGSEAGITEPGATSFSVGIASFSGGDLFVPNSSALLANGALAYNCHQPVAQVDFSLPISSVTFFYVSGDGYAAGTATAYRPRRHHVGTAEQQAATTKEPGQLRDPQLREPIARDHIQRRRRR